MIGFNGPDLKVEDVIAFHEIIEEEDESTLEDEQPNEEEHKKTLEREYYYGKNRYER